MNNPLIWQHPYARQAKADLAAYEVLRDSSGLPQCQSLHFLQMACEKLCKAYLCSSREIELLAPTIDTQRRPDNCEYPWEDAAGNVIVPAEYTFVTLSLLSETAGQELLKIIPLAIAELL